MPLEVWTGQHHTRPYPDGLDITRGTGDVRFASAWSNIMASKRGEITPEQYTEVYLGEMRRSYREHRDAWDELLARPSVTLLCYCRPGKFCHRLVLARNILTKLGAIYLGEH